jgi:uncharacterized membrane protein
MEEKSMYLNNKHKIGCFIFGLFMQLVFFTFIWQTFDASEWDILSLILLYIAIPVAFGITSSTLYIVLFINEK